MKQILEQKLYVHMNMKLEKIRNQEGVLFIMKKKVVIVLVTCLIILIAISTLILVNNIHKNEQKKQILSNIEDEVMKIEKYYVYGTHFNVEGLISNIDISNIIDINFILTDASNNKKEYNAIYTIVDNKVQINTSNLINEGIYLEDIECGDYILLLKVSYSNGIKYYSMTNNTTYKDIEYYTITKNNSNKKINISFETYKAENKDIPYIKFNINRVALPSSVYDISIDPGHGGSDPGAVYKNYKESEIAMKHSAELKQALEKLGLKVVLTRDGTEDTSRTSKFNVYSVYDFDGRVNIVGRSKAKYNFSIHLNSSDGETLGGTEVYAPSKASLNFAQLIADNIVNIAKTTYSVRNLDKVSEGVYVRTFTESQISSSAKDARKKGYEPYNITTSTPYLYMIREIGGIVTGAYIDGRNKEVGTNMYHDSNIGVESYLIELGYIINKTDLDNMLNNQSAYVEAIAKSIEEYICKK